MKKFFFSKTQKYLFWGLTVVVLAICIISVKYYASSAAMLNSLGSPLVPSPSFTVTHSETYIDHDASGKAYLIGHFKVTGDFDSANIKIGGATRSVSLPLSSSVTKVASFTSAWGNWQYNTNSKVLEYSVSLDKLHQTLSSYPGLVDKIGNVGIKLPNTYSISLCKGSACSKFSLLLSSVNSLLFSQW